MKAFVQTKDGKYPSEMFLTVAHGFEYFGYEVHNFEAGDYRGITRETPVFAGVNQFENILKLLNVKYKVLPSYPDCLKEFFGRKIIESTMGEAKRIVNSGGQVFVKPVDEHRKYFHGRVVVDRIWPLYFQSVPDDFPVYICEKMLNLVSEYRVFINQDLIIDARKYRGDFRILPDFKVVEDAVTKFQGNACAYCLDFGVTFQGETLLMEVTDANSVGHYGLDPVLFANLIINRWNEIVS